MERAPLEKHQRADAGPVVEGEPLGVVDQTGGFPVSGGRRRWVPRERHAYIPCSVREMMASWTGLLSSTKKVT